MVAFGNSQRRRDTANKKSMHESKIFLSLPLAVSSFSVERVWTPGAHVDVEHFSLWRDKLVHIKRVFIQKTTVCLS